jgi:hypothetical protein
MGQKSSKSFIIYKLNLIHIYTLINFRVLGQIFQNYFFPKSLNYTLFNKSISIHILTNTYFTVVKKKVPNFLSGSAIEGQNDYENLVPKLVPHFLCRTFGSTRPVCKNFLLTWESKCARQQPTEKFRELLVDL